MPDVFKTVVAALCPLTLAVMALPFWADSSTRVDLVAPLMGLPFAYHWCKSFVPEVQLPAFAVSFEPTRADPETFGITDRSVARVTFEVAVDVFETVEYPPLDPWRSR